MWSSELLCGYETTECFQKSHSASQFFLGDILNIKKSHLNFPTKYAMQKKCKTNEPKSPLTVQDVASWTQHCIIVRSSQIQHFSQANLKMMMHKDVVIAVM